MAAHKGRRGHPRRFFGGFLIVQKATRRPLAAKYPQIKRHGANLAGGDKPLPYGCQRV